jgi:hypothetical protein
MKNGFLLIVSFFLHMEIFSDFQPLEQLHSYPYELKEAVAILQKMPQIRHLIHNIQQKGFIDIVLSQPNSFDFDALWNGEKRVIIVNLSNNKFLSSQIQTILFELHNATSNHHFMTLVEKARNHQISKELYVESIERMEHANALNTSQLIEMGIKKGIFPLQARWEIFPKFDDYYKLQQLQDHSSWIAKNYDYLSQTSGQHFFGTINLPLLSAEDKKDMLYFLTIKNDLNSYEAHRALLGTRKICKELAQIDACQKGVYPGDCSRTHSRLRIFQLIFDTIKNT